MERRLAGKIALITGASRGLGRYCAEAFGREGATVIVAARSAIETSERPGTITETARLIEEAGGAAWPVTCDVANPESIQSMVGAVLDKVGRIDVLMTNAIYYASASFMTITPEDWHSSFQINVHGVFHTIRAVAPSMIAQGSGNVINVSSVAAQKGSPYGATKRVIQGMTLGMAEDLKPHGVAVNALRPVAGIDTPGWRSARSAAVSQTRAHRLSPPDSYVEAAILLATQTAASCTGEELTDAQVLKRFGGAETFEHFRAMNAPVWSEA